MGWRGPVFWPDAYHDMWGYAVSSGTVGETLWAYAYDDVFASIFWPPSPDQAGDLASSGRLVRPADRRKRGEVGFAALSPEFARICSARAPGLTDWPFERIEQTVRPTGAALTAYVELKTAANSAIATLHAACPRETPSTPVARLDAIRERLAAMLDAVGAVGDGGRRHTG